MKNLEYSVASYRYDIEFWALQPNYSRAPECPPAVQSYEKLALKGYNEIQSIAKLPIFRFFQEKIIVCFFLKALTWSYDLILGP